MSDVATAADAARAALAAAAGGPAVAVVTIVEAGPGSPPAGSRRLLFEDGAIRGGTGDAALDAALDDVARRALASDDAFTEEVAAGAARCTVLAEPHRAPLRLLVVGAGHIAVPLVRLAAGVGFQVTVLDDREDFAESDRFPEAERVLRVDFAEPFADVEVGPRSWVVLVTRAHRYDFDCLRRLLDAEAAPRYIGMIGSRRRVRAALGALADAGVPRERLLRVSAPLGLDIGAETPEEIALSIVAELIEVRRGADSGARLSRKERIVERLLAAPREPEGAKAEEMGPGGRKHGD